MKYELTESQINNLIVFLNRVNYEGLKDINAINEILQSLNNPIDNKDTNVIKNDDTICK